MECFPHTGSSEEVAEGQHLLSQVQRQESNIHLSGSETSDPLSCLLFNSDYIRRHWRGSRDEGLGRESRFPSQLWFPHPWDLGWTYTQVPGGKKAASHGTSLVAPWLGPRDPKAGGPGSILGQGPRSHMLATKTGTGKSIKKAKIAFKEPMITPASLSYYEIRGQNGIHTCDPHYMWGWG